MLWYSTATRHPHSTIAIYYSESEPSLAIQRTAQSVGGYTASPNHSTTAMPTSSTNTQLTTAMRDSSMNAQSSTAMPASSTYAQTTTAIPTSSNNAPLNGSITSASNATRHQCQHQPPARYVDFVAS